MIYIVLLLVRSTGNRVNGGINCNRLAVVKYVLSFDFDSVHPIEDVVLIVPCFNLNVINYLFCYVMFAIKSFNKSVSNNV